MSYTSQLTFAQWVQLLNQTTSNTVNNIKTGETLFQKWGQMVYGLSDAQILALPQLAGMAQADLNNIRYALGALDTLNTAMNAVTPVVFAYLEPFI